MIPAGQRDQTQVDRVVNLLRRQGIEVHRATGAVTVKEGEFAAGSYLVKLNQPYGRLAKTLLEKQTYPDPQLTTYDDSAWTMPLANNIEVKTIEDKGILDVPATLLSADVVTTGSLHRGDWGRGRVLRRQAQRLPEPDHVAVPPQGHGREGGERLLQGRRRRVAGRVVPAAGIGSGAAGHRVAGSCRPCAVRDARGRDHRRGSAPHRDVHDLGQYRRRSGGCVSRSIASRSPSI